MKIAIIGGGAAGLMCACRMSPQHDVTLVDKNTDLGKKLLITGKGRCNLTNLVEPKEFLQSIAQNRAFLSKAVHAFSPHATVDFFESIGVVTQMENNNRVFPVAGKATAVKNALQAKAVNSSVKILLGHNVLEIKHCVQEDKHDKAAFTLTMRDIQAEKECKQGFDAVVVATGGLSFPLTGSSGDGFVFAEKLGHAVAPTRPSLCGLKFVKPTGFQGTCVMCGVSIVDKHHNAKTAVEVGDMMFTKNGVSGPNVFKAVAAFKEHTIANHRLQIDFVPNIERAELQKKIEYAFKHNARKTPFYVFRNFVPVNVANWLVELCRLPRNKVCAVLTSAERESVVAQLCQTRVAIEDFESIVTATITRGGVEVGDVCDSTMQSKKIKNLYFIGEVLDVDGLSGGFNLQIAFSTACVCADNLAKQKM